MVLRFHIRLYANGVLVRKLATGKQKRISSVLDRYEWDEAHLTVAYGETGMSNGGVYTNKEELKKALTAFTEIELKNYIMGVVEE